MSEKDVRAEIEPGADLPGLTGEGRSLRSIAISLKRIADRVDPHPKLPLTAEQIEGMRAKWDEWLASPPPDQEYFRSGVPHVGIPNWLKRALGRGR